MWSNQRNVTLDSPPPVKLSTLPFGSICGFSDGPNGRQLGHGPCAQQDAGASVCFE